MTTVDAIKQAVHVWWVDCDELREKYKVNGPWLYPDYIAKFLQIIHRLKHEVFNFETGTWEYEGF